MVRDGAITGDIKVAEERIQGLVGWGGGREGYGSRILLVPYGLLQGRLYIQIGPNQIYLWPPLKSDSPSLFSVLGASYSCTGTTRGSKSSRIAPVARWTTITLISPRTRRI